MLEETVRGKARNTNKTIERELNSPLSLSFEVLVYLRHREGRGLPTAAEDAERDLNIANRTVRECFEFMKEAHLVKEVPERREGGVIITDKGVRLIFEGIRPIFIEQEKIVEKVFFHQILTHSDLIEQDILTTLKKFGKHTSKSHKAFFKSWLSKKFGDYVLFDEWIGVLNDDYFQFSKQDLKEFIEKNLKKKGGLE